MILATTGVNCASHPRRNNVKFLQNKHFIGVPAKSNDMMNTLGLMGRINMAQVNFGSSKKYAGHELNFSEAELDKRLKDQTSTIKLLEANAPKYKELAKGDKKALFHLVKAAEILNDVFLDMDHHKNLALKQALVTEAQKGDTHAQKTLKLFNGMQGITGLDRMSERTFLFKDTENYKGKNFYPPGTTEEELIADLNNKFKNDDILGIRQILSQRTVVKKDASGNLKGVDYVDAYPKHFQKAAVHLEKAAEVSTNDDFNKYLLAQAKAFKKADPELDAEADRLWAKLQDTPLEFTITREQYEDELSGAAAEDKKLLKQLKKHKIDFQSKDAIGVRVGIVNKEGTQELLDFKKYLPALADQMPFKEKYTQAIKPKGDVKQTMVDVDLVYLTGDVGSYRGGITLAENLPNDDKLSVQRGYGRRNAYHRQIRLGGNPEKIQKRLDATLKKELHKYYKKEADHDFTIGHENAHSLGPSNGKAALGNFANIIEEAKADMGSLASLDYLVEKGKYTEDKKKEILTSWANNELLKSKPDMSQAHRVRSVMQLNYFIEKGALEIDDKGILDVHYEKMVPTAKQMLSDIVQIQMGKDPKKAEDFVAKYFQWTDKIEKSASNIRKIDNTLHGVLEHTLADKILKRVSKAIK
ncbi:MAG: hypothetical protein PHE78_02505 [Candidatus Gastranaerophilales bacterium]|nr:hypothetical protein [Candidatus Gastranaerophilales bacterium]